MEKVTIVTTDRKFPSAETIKHIENKFNRKSDIKIVTDRGKRAKKEKKEKDPN